MPDYVKTTWVNGGAPGISAENLNKLETQYETVKTELQRTDGTSAIQVHGSNIVNDSIPTVKLKADVTRLIVLTPGAAILPSSGAPALSQINGTNFPFYALDFDQATDETAFWEFIVPADFVSQNVTISAWWLSTVTSGAVTWALQTGSRGSGAAFDSALGTAQTVTTTTAGTAGYLNKSTFPAFNPGWTARQIGIIKLYRDADNASDTMAADARLVMLEIGYSGR